MEEYESSCWPQLASAITHFLQFSGEGEANNVKKLSYQDIYTVAYKVVFSRLAARLYDDVINHLEITLRNLTQNLIKVTNNC